MDDKKRNLLVAAGFSLQFIEELEEQDRSWEELGLTEEDREAFLAAVLDNLRKTYVP